MSRPLSDQKFRRAQFTRLKERKAEIARLREEQGATDPILIIAGIAITLILLVGGSFAISGFIGNANDLNAKGDLDRIATAQAAYFAENDVYATYVSGPNISTPKLDLETSSIGFRPTAGNSFIVRTGSNGWVATVHSASDTVFIRSSFSSQIFDSTQRAQVTLPAGVSASQLLSDINNVRS